MISISNKQQCNGCGACVQKCPLQCISFQEDEEGFFYPMVNKEVCINCHVCEKICPSLNRFNTKEPIKAFAIINKNANIRIQSSSGGIFSLIAERVIRDCGVVFGARFDEKWQVIIDYTESIDGITNLRGSKYVQAWIGDSYRQCETFLKKGRKVLFSGSPCQIAGLNHFLQKEYPNLITCNFVCHGVPSPKVWSKYLFEIAGKKNRTITEVQFRNKDNGWKHYHFKLAYFENGEEGMIYSYHKNNPYMRAFLEDLILRPSCYNCQSKHGRSKSDITIADLWGVQKIKPEMDDDKGVGLVLINTQKGFSSIEWPQTEYFEINYNEVKSYSRGMKSKVSVHRNRSTFFSKIDTTDSIENLIQICLKPTFIQKMNALFDKYRLLLKNTLQFL